jgi:hypothetical protein
LLVAFLLLVLSGSGGCAAVGLAAVGPMLSSFAALGDRTVERTVPADLPTTWGATVDALARMAVHLETSEKSGIDGNSREPAMGPRCTERSSESLPG